MIADFFAASTHVDSARYRERWLATREFYKDRIAGGFDAFAQAWRNRRIEWFEGLDKSLFEPRVLKWIKPGEANKTWMHREAISVFSERDYADKPESVHENARFSYEDLKIVPVESETSIPVTQRFAKMSKKAQRELLGLVCDKMIERKAFDEIGGLLTAYLEGDAPLIMKLMGGGAVSDIAVELLKGEKKTQ